MWHQRISIGAALLPALLVTLGSMPVQAESGPTSIDTSSAQIRIVATMADLRRNRNGAPGDRIELLSWSGDRDSGGGVLRLDPTDTTSRDNGCTLFVDAAGHRWKRVADGQEIKLSWCGADLSGKSASDEALANAVGAAGPDGVISIDLPGTLKLTRPVVKPESFHAFSLHGLGPQRTTIDYRGLPAGQSLFRFVGGSGRLARAFIDGIRFFGAGGQSATRALEIDGQDGMRILNDTFDNQVLATVAPILLHNESKGSFTEFVTVEDFEFSSAAPIALEYRVTDGSVSFHGSGLKGGIAHSGTSPLIVIGHDAMPYEAPLDVQVFASHPATLIENESKRSAFFFGALNVELPGRIPRGSCRLAGGTTTYFSGSILQLGTCDLGTLLQVSRLIVHGEDLANRTSYSLLPTHRSISGVSSGVKLASVSALGSEGYQAALLSIRFFAPNYEFRVFGYAEHNGYGAPGTWTPISAGFSNNTAGYGPPAISVDKNGDVMATNPRWPAGRVSVEISVNPQTGAFGSMQ